MIENLTQIENLNTSNVTVNRDIYLIYFVSFYNLNTSNVTVNRRK